MSISNESSRIRSWFQFSSKSSTNNTSNASNARSDDDNKDNNKDINECLTQTQTTQTNTLLERVTTFRRSLTKDRNRHKHKIRPTSTCAKGLTSAVEQQNIAKSKTSTTQRKSSSPTATSGGSVASVTCDDDEIYGFTSANFDSSNSNTRRALKSSLHIAPNATNISVYESDTNKSGRVRNEDESHLNANVVHSNIANICKGVSKDSPEWLKADGEFSFYHQQNQHSFDSRDSIGSRLYYYQKQYFQDGDIHLRHSSTQHLSWTEPLNSEPDDIDRIYENMRGLSTAITNSQQRQHNQRNISSNNCSNSSNSYVNSNLNNTSESVSNNRKLTKDSGYESASTSISNWAVMNPNANALSNNYFHSRSDSNASSVSTGGSLSPRTAAGSAKSAYHYSEPWSTAKSTSNLPLQVQVSNNSGIRRSSLSNTSNAYSEGFVNTGKSVLPAKSVPGNLDRDSDESLLRKRSHNRNNPTPSSVYSLLASKSGFDFAPVLKLTRKSCGSSFSENPFFTKYNERILSKGSDSNSCQLWKSREKNSIQTCSEEERYSIADDSPPPTPPVRDSSLASNRKFNSESQQSDAQSLLIAESMTKTNESTIPDTNSVQSNALYYKNNNSQYYMKSYSENSVSHIGGYSKSLINLRSKNEESSDLKQFSQTYPLLPEAEFMDKQMQESWSCDQSVTSGVTSLVTSSDYFTASSSVITHSPSLSSLNTNATNTTTASYNNSRNSVSSTSSSSQIARSAKVLQPKRQESASVLYYEKSQSDSVHREREVPPPPPPPKLHFTDYHEKETTSQTSSTYGNKMVSMARSIDSASKTSDSEIKAIQKRALYQFYLKQKQKEKQENSITNASPVAANDDSSQVPSRKVQLVVHENIYENNKSACLASPPSPPLPPPPPSVAENEFIGDLPLPPPPSPQPLIQSDRENASISSSIAHSISQNIIAEPSFSKSVQQLANASTPPPIELVSISRASDVVSQKSEIATQTTETLRRNSGGTSAKDMTQLNNVSLETRESMYQNEVLTTGNRSSANKSIESVESVVPWAYSQLWPNEKCAKTIYYDNDSSHISNNTCSPIRAANTFIGDTGVPLSCASNEDLLANKSELITRLSRKLDVLRSEEIALSQDIEANETVGQQVKDKLKALGITAQESEKINLHCDETEKVTRLLLSISARLQLIQLQINERSDPKCQIDEKVLTNTFTYSDVTQSMQPMSQNDLQQMRDKHSSYSSSNLFDEIELLVMKREKLLIQLEEALQLRVSINNRSVIIEEKILKKYFHQNNEQLNEFIEFIKLKSKLIVDIREIRDKIQLGEKHLYALKAS